MSIILSDVGALQLLKKVFPGTQPTNSLALATAGSMLLKLYVNNVVPSDTDTAAVYTEVIANDAGYNDVELLVGGWTVQMLNNIAESRYAQQNFAFTGALDTTDGKSGTIFGYYVVDSDGVLLFAERAAVAFTPVSPNDTVMLTPIFQMAKGVPT